MGRYIRERIYPNRNCRLNVHFPLERLQSWCFSDCSMLFHSLVVAILSTNHTLTDKMQLLVCTMASKFTPGTILV